MENHNKIIIISKINSLLSISKHHNKEDRIEAEAKNSMKGENQKGDQAKVQINKSLNTRKIRVVIMVKKII